ncbi:MAG: TolC family protein, partial [Betaproteobacteria bacterium]|nr:TolC family protein [Betaproteobacteria bacterium]
MTKASLPSPLLPLFLLLAVLLPGPGLAAVPASYDLEQLLDLARRGNWGLQASRDAVDAARAGITSAGAFPNPEIEVLHGDARARTPGATPGNVRSLNLTQRLDMPWVRSARIDAASANLDATSAAGRGYEHEVLAAVKLGYYEVLRRQAELQAAQEDQSLMEAIRSRVNVRVEIGEAPRYELIKADAELLNAQKAAQSAVLRLAQAKAALRRNVGAGLPESFEVPPSTHLPTDAGSLPALRQTLRQRSPELAQARAQLSQAEHQLNLQRRLRTPEVALKAGRDEDPDLNSSRVGIAVTIPLWDRRTGPIDEANANLSRARHNLEQLEFGLAQSLENAYQQHQIASAQVTALEQGIVRQAEAALKVAESAYRFGERGILDYLDAQRVYRAARNELIAARYELRAAAVDI